MHWINTRNAASGRLIRTPADRPSQLAQFVDQIMSDTTIYRDGDVSYWENYLKGRPKYSQKFFDTIFAYHKKHGGDWGVSYDVGTGAGQAASLFAPKFKTVIGSDMEESQIRVAATRLAHVQNLEFIHSRAERLSDRFPGHSADLVAVSEALPLMDVREVLQSAATLLKPGGTFAAWYYGRPLFVCDASDELDVGCNDAYSNLVDAIYRDIVPHVLEFMPKAKLQVLMEHQASGLADVELPQELFEDVHRHTWNDDIGSMSFVSSLPAIGLDDNWTK